MFKDLPLKDCNNPLSLQLSFKIHGLKNSILDIQMPQSIKAFWNFYKENLFQGYVISFSQTWRKFELNIFPTFIKTYKGKEYNNFLQT